ncbi:MAG: FAD-dependent oxidoreductase [Thermoplasmata archaeon]|nr:MAG: FAD-dependent oxidoreductase [Thermoplasmata archaeon]
MKNIAVMGAGVTGLYSSLELLKRGYKVVLIEAKSKVGGMARSVIDEDFTFDVGSHVIHTNDPKYKRFISDLLGDDLLEKNITAKTYFDGKFHNFPPIMRDIFHFRKKKALRIFFALLKGRVNQFRRKKPSFEEQLMFLAGRDLYETYFEGYTAKFWGISPKNLSSEWVPKRVIPRFTGRSALANEWQAYPKHGGIEAIPQKMAKNIEEKGGIIHLNAKLKSVQEKDNKVTIIAIETNGGEQKIACDGVIFTIPLPLIFEIFGKKFDLKYRSMIFVFLKLKGTEILPDTTICFFPSSKLPFTRLYEMAKYSPLTCPEGYTSLGVEIPCFYQDKSWNKKDDDTAEEVVNYLENEKIIKRENLKGYIVQKERYSYPIPTIEYYQKIEKLRASLKISNLHLAGRMGYFKYLDMCDAMESGERAVNSLISSHEK